MKRNKRPTSKSTTIKIRDIKDNDGTINIAARDITTHQTTSGLNAADLNRLFEKLYTDIDVHTRASPAAKEDIKAEVQEIQSTVTEAVKKNKEVEESVLARRFRNIARMAPDVLDVVVATLGNPLAGLGIAARKIAEKAKEDAK